MKRIIVLLLLLTMLMSCSTTKQAEWDRLPQNQKREIIFRSTVSVLATTMVATYLLVYPTLDLADSH